MSVRAHKRPDIVPPWRERIAKHIRRVRQSPQSILLTLAQSDDREFECTDRVGHVPVIPPWPAATHRGLEYLDCEWAATILELGALSARRPNVDERFEPAGMARGRGRCRSVLDAALNRELGSGIVVGRLGSRQAAEASQQPNQ